MRGLQTCTGCFYSPPFLRCWPISNRDLKKKTVPDWPSHYRKKSLVSEDLNVILIFRIYMGGRSRHLWGASRGILRGQSSYIFRGGQSSKQNKHPVCNCTFEILIAGNLIHFLHLSNYLSLKINHCHYPFLCRLLPKKNKLPPLSSEGRVVRHWAPSDPSSQCSGTLPPTSEELQRPPLNLCGPQECFWGYFGISGRIF